MNLAERVSIESKLLPKIMWEQEVNSKKKEKEKKSLQKLIYLPNVFQNAFQILLLDKLWRMLLSEIFGDNISRICLEFEKIPSIKLSSLTS